jgi:hypothetical protein
VQPLSTRNAGVTWLGCEAWRAGLTSSRPSHLFFNVVFLDSAALRISDFLPIFAPTSCFGLLLKRNIEVFLSLVGRTPTLLFSGRH